MAVRTYGPQILNGIDLVIRSNRRQLVEVMDVNTVTGHHLPVHGNKVEATKDTRCPVMFDAIFPGAGITLIAVNQNSLYAAFVVG
jgi:hypothetical protein